MELPVNHANTRFIFTCAGVLDPMSFAIGNHVSLGDSASDIADKQYNAWQPFFAASGSSFIDDWTFVGTSTTLMTVTGPVVGEHLAPIVGSSTANGQSVNTAVLVRKNTASGGRKNRGRLFVPPFDLEEEIVNTAGFISPADVTQYQAQWDDYFAEAGVQGLDLVLFHSDPADAPTPITGFTVQSLCATQRRRMR